MSNERDSLSSSSRLSIYYPLTTRRVAASGRNSWSPPGRVRKGSAKSVSISQTALLVAFAITRETVDNTNPDSCVSDFSKLCSPQLPFRRQSDPSEWSCFGQYPPTLGIARDPDGKVEPWEAEVHTHGARDTYVQHLVLAPGGYSGWHTHPGILIATVVSGSVDFYDARCQKQSFGPGRCTFENGNVHAIANTASVNADLYLAYLSKHDSPRRLY